MFASDDTPAPSPEPHPAREFVKTLIVAALWAAGVKVGEKLGEWAIDAAKKKFEKNLEAPKETGTGTST